MDTHVAPQQRRNSASRRCTAISADGSSYPAWAVRGSEPSRCASHGGARSKECAIDAVIADLHGKQECLSRYIDENIDDLTPADLVRFLRLHAQGCSRLGRLLRDRDILTGGVNAEIDAIIIQALDGLGVEWRLDP